MAACARIPRVSVGAIRRASSSIGNAPSSYLCAVMTYVSACAVRGDLPKPMAWGIGPSNEGALPRGHVVLGLQVEHRDAYVVAMITPEDRTGTAEQQATDLVGSDVRDRYADIGGQRAIRISIS
jgi:hypothetical protein